MAKFEIFQDAQEFFRFRLKADNWKVIAVGEGYVSKQGCKDTISSIKELALRASVEDLTII